MKLSITLVTCATMFAVSAETITWDGSSKTGYEQEDGSIVFPAETDVAIIPTAPVKIATKFKVDGKLTLDTTNVATLRTVTGYLPGSGETGVIFENCRLGDIVAMRATVDGGSMAAARGPDEGLARIFEHKSDSMRVQFQALESDYLKAAFYTFTQIGDDVAVTGGYCNYFSKGDFGKVLAENTNYLLADEAHHSHDYKHYYGAKDVIVTLIDSNFEIAGGFEVKGDIELAGFGVVTLNAKEPITLTNKLVGTGSLRIFGELSPIACKYRKYLTEEYAKIASNAKLDDLVVTGGIISGAKMTTDSVDLNKTKLYPVGNIGMVGGPSDYYSKEDSNPEKGIYFKTVHEDGTITYQLQVRESAGYLKGVILELKQEGADIMARTPKAYYASRSFGYDLTKGTSNKVGDGGYGLHTLNFTLPGYNAVTLNADNTGLIGGIVVNGKLVSATGKGVSQKNLVMVSGPQAELNFDVSQLSYTHSGHNREFFADNGASIGFLYAWSIGYNEWVRLSNSTLNLGEYPGQYMNRVEMAGSKINPLVETSGCRVGYHSNPTWRVLAGAQSEIALKVNLYGRTNGIWTLDVIGDLLVTGELHKSSEVGGVVAINKTGVGTLTLAHANSFIDGITLRDGTLVLADAAAIPVSNTLTLDGGVVRTAAGVSPVCGPLALTGDAAIVAPGKGDVLSFADSSEVDWIEGKVLTINGALQKKSIRFGETATSLTRKQLKAIRSENGRGGYVLDAEGYLTPASGFTVMVR